MADAQLALQANRDGEGLGSGCSTMTVQPSAGRRAPTPSISARARLRTEPRTWPRPRASPATCWTSGVVAHVVAARHTRLRIRVAMRQQQAFVGDDERIPWSPTRMRSTIRHIASRFKSPDEPSAALAVVETDGDDRGRQQVVVDREARHQRALDGDALRSGHADSGVPRRLDTMGRPFSSSSVSSRYSGNSSTKFLRMRSCCHALRGRSAAGRPQRP